MLRLRILLIGVFCWIALLVAIGRSDQLPLVGELQPAFYVYLIAAASMGFMVLYPEYASKPMQVTFVPLMVIYGACKAVESTGQIIDPPFYYLLGAELIVLFVTTYLARWTSLATSNTEESILVAKCDPRLIEDTRRNWPFLRDRRIDAYAPILSRYLGA